MELRDVDGVRFVRLEPLAYQTAEANGDPYDDNWLVIDGAARSDDEQWTFREPCLLVGEARALGDWLRSVAESTAATMATDVDGNLAPTTEHLEPNLGFGVVGFENDRVTLRVFLWLESGPASVRDSIDDSELEWFMDLTVTRDDLRAAAADWTTQLQRFPVRT